MSFPARHTFAISGCLLVAFLVNVSSFAQEQHPDTFVVESPTVSSGTALSLEPQFIEIFLTDEGVIATDTAYDDWYYDFVSRKWVAGILPSNPNASKQDFLDPDQEALEDRCTEEKKVDPFEKTVIVGFDEFVDGDIIASGRVTVKGWVKGNVTSIGKRVLVTEFGRVDGDVIAPQIITKHGAVITGQIIETDLPMEFSDFTEQVNVDGIIAAVVITTLMLFFAFLATTLMPGQVERINSCINENGSKSFLLGMLFVFLMPVVFLLVIITIVGIFLVPFVVLAYVAAILLGIISFGERFGQTVSRKYLGGEKGKLFHVFVGTFLLMSAWIVVALFATHGGDSGEAFAGVLAFIVGLFTIYASFSGIGAVILTRFGFKTYVIWHQRQSQGEAPTPAPPPLSEVPPVQAPSDKSEKTDESN